MRVKPYIISSGIVTAATFLQVLLMPVVGVAPFILYYPAIVVASLCGNGLFALFLSIILAQVVFLTPNEHALNPMRSIYLQMLFFSSGLLIWWISSRLTYSHQQLKNEKIHALDVGKKLTTTLMSVEDAVVTTDRFGRIQLINGSAELLTGWTLDEVKGRMVADVFQFINEEDSHSTIDPVGAVLNTGKSLAPNTHTVLVCKDGRRVVIEDSTAPILDETGSITGVVLVFRDSTEKKQTEARLKESEKLFRTLADTAPVLIWISDTSKNCIWFNKPWLDFTGRTLNEEYGLGWAENIHPDDLEQCLRGYVAEFDKKVQYTLEYRLRRFDGSYVWVLNRGIPRFTEDGTFLGYIGSCVDIDERKKMEQELKWSRDRLHLVLTSIDIGLWFCDLPFNILNWDERVRAHFFIPAGEEVTIDMFYDRIHKADREKVRAAVEKSIQNHTAYEMDYRTVDPYSGSMRWVRSIGTTVYDFKGVPIRFDGISLDVTDRKRVESYLLESETYFRTMVDTSPAILWMTDASGYCIYWSKQWYELTGRSLEEDLGFGWLENVHKEDRESVEDVFLTSNRAHQSFKTDFRLCRHDGSCRWVVYSGSARFASDGAYLGFIGTVVDVNEVKIAEQAAQEAIRARDEFLSIASHELKTPLTSLKLQTQMRQRSLNRGEFSSFTPEKLTRMVEVDSRQIERLGRLVDDMLDISRITTGRLTMSYESVKLGSLIQDVVERLAPQFEAASCPITVEKLTEEIVGLWDRYRIEQVLLNLLTNAIKYGAGKPVTVRLASADGFAIIKVQDEGRGIAEKDHSRIFQRFERAISANEISGLGLGLYITRKIVEAHGGSIRVESILGKGSTFTVEVPLASHPHVTGHASFAPPINEFNSTDHS